jgi:RTC4-like domain
LWLAYKGNSQILRKRNLDSTYFYYSRSFFLIAFLQHSYGELGSVIIHQTLYNLFPPSEFDSSLVAPLSHGEFIQCILVPEVGVRLIMEDKGMKGAKGVAEAVQILRESANYGVAMFPEDGGEWDNPGGRNKANGEGTEAADMIVMERALRRRQELEMEEGDIFSKERSEKSKRAAGKSNGKGKAKARGAVDQQVVVEVQTRDASRPKVKQRPKPKPMIPQVNADDTTDSRPKPKLVHNGKGKSKPADLYSSEIELSSSDQEVGGLHSQQTPKRTPMAARDVSPTASDFCPDGLDREVENRRTTRGNAFASQTKNMAPKITYADSTDSDSSAISDSAPIRRYVGPKGGLNGNARKKKPNTYTSTDDEEVEVLIPSYGDGSAMNEDTEATPRPPQKIVRSFSRSSSTASVFPLLIAKGKQRRPVS